MTNFKIDTAGGESKMVVERHRTVRTEAGQANLHAVASRKERENVFIEVPRNFPVAQTSAAGA